MSRVRRDRSVLNPKARGGDTAGGGFAFQDAFIVSMVPGWLNDPRFARMIRESLGDVEAIFFDPEMGERVSFTEFKNDHLTLKPFWKEIARFRELDDGTRIFDRFELVCRSVSEPVVALVRQLRRVRGAISFYESESTVQKETYEHLVESIESAKGQRRDAELLLRKVDVDFGAPDAEGLQEALFSQRLHDAFPTTKKVPGSKINEAHRALSQLVSSRRGKVITRSEIEDVLWGILPRSVRPSTLDLVPIHIVHDESERYPPAPGARAIQLRWERFFGGEGRHFPDASEWDELVTQAQSIRQWISQEKRPRRLAVTGQRRLSASVALGSVFSAVAGFALELEFRGAWWRSDDYSVPGRAVVWDVAKFRPSKGGAAAVSIGLPRSISADVEAHLAARGLKTMSHLALHSPNALRSASEANAAVASAKNVIAEFLQETGAESIDMFLATPSPFAVFLGHHLNATAAIRCHEFVTDRSYRHTCTLRLD
jgi:hypothetical protein